MNEKRSKRYQQVMIKGQIIMLSCYAWSLLFFIVGALIGNAYHKLYGYLKSEGLLTLGATSIPAGTKLTQKN